MAGTLHVTGDPAADQQLNTDGTALLLAMLFDQQVPIEWAFRAPATLTERLGHLDADRIAAMDPDDFVEVCCRKPAVHRFPAAMGRRAHALCQVVAQRYDGRGENVWAGVGDADELHRRLRELPGYGDEKSRIFVALLAKRIGVKLDGWEAVAGPFADAEPRTVADIDGPEALAAVRAWKKAQKAAGKSKQD